MFLLLFLFKFRKFHLLEVNEVSEVKEVNDVCFVRQMVIYIPHGGIVDNFVNSVNSERSDNFRKLSYFYFCSSAFRLAALPVFVSHSFMAVFSSLSILLNLLVCVFVMNGQTLITFLHTSS